jgi:hypothetical protein
VHSSQSLSQISYSSSTNSIDLARSKILQGSVPCILKRGLKLFLWLRFEIHGLCRRKKSPRRRITIPYLTRRISWVQAQPTNESVLGVFHGSIPIHYQFQHVVRNWYIKGFGEGCGEGKGAASRPTALCKAISATVGTLCMAPNIA